MAYAKPKAHQHVNFWSNGKKPTKTSDGKDDAHLSGPSKIESKLLKLIEQIYRTNG